MNSVKELRHLLNEPYSCREDFKSEVAQLCSQELRFEVTSPNLACGSEGKLKNCFFYFLNNISSSLNSSGLSSKEFQYIFFEDSKWKVTWYNKNANPMAKTEIVVNSQNKSYYGQGKGLVHKSILGLQLIEPEKPSTREELLHQMASYRKRFERTLFTNTRDLFLNNYLDGYDKVRASEIKKAQEYWQVFLNNIGVIFPNIPKKNHPDNLYLIRKTIEASNLRFYFNDVVEWSLLSYVVNDEYCQKIMKGKTNIQHIINMVSEKKNEETKTYKDIIDFLQASRYEK